VTSKPTVPDVLPLVRALYATEHGGCGGCLHLVLDDGNVADDNVRYCLGIATERGCAQCAELGALLLRMSKTQRLKVRR
jgi:hypothetical protein